MQGVLIDLDGVVYQNDELLPGADKTVRWLQQQGIPHLFVTNTTSKPKAALIAKLARMGIVIPPQALLTPPTAAASYLKARPPGAVALFLPSATAEDFADLPLLGKIPAEQSPTPLPLAAVILGDLADQWSFATLNRAFTLLMTNPHAELIALGMTRYWRAAEGLQLDVGPFVAALAFAVERDPVVMGKPSAAFFAQACRTLGLSAEDLCMIGDDARADVAGAQTAGIQGVLVQTGKFQPSDLEKVNPDWLLPSFADLPDHWQQVAGNR